MFFTVFLSGCSFWGGVWSEKQESELLSVSETRLWQFYGVSADDVALLLKGKGLVTPVYQVLSSNEMLPDYVRTAKLYDALRQSGLSLVPVENTLRWHYKMIAAVEHKCPKGATDPLPSCEYYHWYSWLPGFGERYDPEALHRLLKKNRVDYLVMADPDLYFSGSDAMHNLRYAPSSLPLVQMSEAKRERLLATVQKEVSLAIVRVEWGGHHVERWSQIVARCSLPLEKKGLTGKQLRQMRGEMLDALREQCIPALFMD
ncbi:hypothetical protein [Sansalvadorimonas verongulae]|uniref:hypothetical protein n=1 Tax=Sansalvadorimonas verongulae TaxID=2172824 RepID=UPI0012BCD509|nr:hypothetical protein [Sansalvadorimonas verongulae]MTI14509.1 hypothetical protein [Sansalvadorimonas verongulae]